MPVADAAGIQRSLDDLELKSHAVCQVIAVEEQLDKETGAHTLGMSRITSSAFPIIPSKVMLFLEYETMCAQKRKRDDGSSSMGTVGVLGVKQVISALEHWCLNNQHKYPDAPAAQIGLCFDLRIKTFESAAAHKEPLHIKMAHTLKAKGTNTDTFTSTNLMRCTVWCLTDFKGPSNIYIGLWD
ncbi:hypothetical protein B0H10DRAFT_1962910 [Mycena sp. CBHHK59/15]|nr:hypothetical protein B0H10DRAFT_1962910 [Mycena sp. CBHHK59/15]